MENVRGKNTKRKHLSKNKKKSWRKVDITDVEEFLEDERHQERTGGKVSEKTDSALFTLDKSKSKHGAKAAEDIIKRKRKAQRELKDIEVSLQPPPAAKKDNRPKDMLERLANRKLPQRFIQARKDRRASRRNTEKKARERPRTSRATYDLWAGDSKLEKKQANMDPHFLDVTKKRRVKVPKHYNSKPSLISAVEIPYPGASYNPAYDEYQDLLRIANAKEEKKLRLEQRIHRALYDKFPTAEEAPTEASELKEMSAGLFEDEEEESGNSDIDQGDLDKLSVNPPSRRENKKDEKKRKKQKLRLEMEKKLKEEKLQRIRDNEIFRLKSIKKELVAKEQKEKENKRRKLEEKAMEPYMTKRLGKQKFEEPDLEVKLSSELVGSLRELKPEGDLLHDRMKSLQKRNIIEPASKRVKIKKKIKSFKYVEKRKHKEIQA